MNPRAAACVVPALAMWVLVGCEKPVEGPGLPADYQPPQAVSFAGSGCAEALKAHPKATWRYLGPMHAPGSKKGGQDKSGERFAFGLRGLRAIAGPFEHATPVQLQHNQALAASVLQLSAKQPLCVRVWPQKDTKPAAGWNRAPAGKVAVDAGIVGLGSVALFDRWSKAHSKGFYACLHAPQKDLEAIGKESKRHGLALRRVLPTFACANRPSKAGDGPLLRRLVKARAADGIVAFEPGKPSQAALDALGERSTALVSAPSEQGAILLAETSPRRGSYGYFVWKDAAGRPVGVEIRLAP